MGGFKQLSKAGFGWVDSMGCRPFLKRYFIERSAYLAITI
jgi:hypothetical protein